MQDFGKDELGLLGTGIVVNNDKDHSGNQSAGVGIGVDEIKLTSIPDLLESGDSSKLEEADRDLYPWHTEADIGSRFLRSSDDPLISGGTNDIPHDNELSVPTDVSRQSMCPSPTTPPPSKHRHSSVTVLSSPDLPETVLSPLPTPPKAPTASPPQQPRARRTPASNTAPRARRKGPIKLRFHHQALPQEYLDHYEATQNNLHRSKDQPPSSSQSKPTARQQQQQQQQQQQRHQTDRSAQQAMMERQAVLEREERANESVRSWLQKILELQKEGIPLAPPRDEPIAQSPPVTLTAAPTAKRVVSYTDLPYMGEITLDNSKPRRGRKPKKADICHLIYKNYGTILPGTPNRELTLEKTPMAKGCSKSVASLLERRLTSSDERNRKAVTAARGTAGGTLKQLCPDEQEKEAGNGMRKESEPLNLCVRDSSGSNCGLLAGEESFSVSSSEEDPDEVFASSCPTPIITQSDLCTDQALAANMKLSLPTLQSSGSGSTTETPSTADTPPGQVYWSSSHAGSLFTHPMPMYFPGQLPMMPATEEPPKTDSLSSTSSPAVSPDGQQQPLLLVPKHISQLIKSESKQPGMAQNGTGSNRRSPPTPKRKRSAIFIPPVPAENSSNPATEVSICKFKFTGGAKPCLQEKKILSVDSGGNFRYYSGTGDKSMRGYEFFPRESLQQSSITATSTTGAFLNASGERIACDLPPPSLGLSSDLLQIPDFPTSPQPTCSHHLQGANGSTPTSPTPSIPGGCREPAALLQHHQQQLQHTASERRRRKSRRATQRECLEKTFKEKGFLIQTQQLQSAEGATYCKFRQLRKFTRYLFRSWKDYLPGELQQQQQQQQQLLPGVILPTELPSDEAPPAIAASTHTIRMLVDSSMEDDPVSSAESVPRKHPAIEGHRTGSVSPIGD
ncbi:proteoglycan 4 isoform X2 [Anopheles aquasalis]|nr:proteoglycan 4 isoform X2 [Anopheles aquasalis]